MMFIYMNKLFLRTFLFILILELNWDVNSLSELSNLPLKSDVIVYLKSIERITEFCGRHKNDIDLNLEFGLFLLNVNLRHFMTKRKTRLPSDLKTNVRRILRANEPLFDFFRFMVNNGNDLNHRKDKNITSLFINVNSWVKRTKEYNTALANKGSSRVEYLVEKYSSWNVYMDHVDDALIDDLCSTIYEEAQYIALNGYKHADLLMEQICLCTLAGHASFLQRRWLSSLLRLQTSHGCFRQNLKPSASVEALATKPWRISKKDTQLIMGKRCNGHVTAVANY
ncbi:hypothetical protein MSG28_000185 [Choristoneura fumiferana]|uniref:Uncharacterized protein n=1 Tax=Choristoneura fumiferana TaxID=7141 RepID=A0ACC0JZK9_CHOFU|nr:hypothetical protein MSG28_000185 [Choristoneura fumiferana]